MKFTISYCQTRDGHTEKRRETQIEAVTAGDAAEAFVKRQIRKGRGFIHAYVIDGDGKRYSITQAKVWGRPATLTDYVA